MRIVHAIAVAVIVAGLCACAPGKTRYQCPSPNGVACKSVKQMYDITDAAGEQGLADAKAALQGISRADSHHEVRHGSMSSLPSRGEYVAVENYAPTGVPLTQGGGTIEPTDPLPLRMPPRVLRVWITPWEDSEGDLHAGGYVFTEIEARRWTLANAPARTSQVVHPLQVEIAGLERRTEHRSSSAVPGATTATPGRESTAASNAKPPERNSGGGGS